MYQIRIKPYAFFAILGSYMRLVRKPLPIPKNMHGMAWVNKSYATALDLQGYYNIRLNKDASKVCTIIISWGLISHKS
jgi:hypothetical protein